MVPRPAALPLGILMVGLGSVLLFVAFHNLPVDGTKIGSPDNVIDFPSFLGHIAQGFQAGVR